MELERIEGQIISCTLCPRLVDWRETVARTRRRAYKDVEYWGRPVPGFGDHQARIMAVGLAPGAHGSNRTGRQFTGDASGDFLFPALHRAGFSSRDASVSIQDGLQLRDLFLTAICRCVPPANKPTPTEILTCRPYLEEEIRLLDPRVIVCLGHLAFGVVAGIHSLRPSDFKFSHGACFAAQTGAAGRHRWLLCSYHPSRQNTQTGRLTPAMFDRIWKRAGELIRDG